MTKRKLTRGVRVRGVHHDKHLPKLTGSLASKARYNHAYYLRVTRPRLYGGK